MTYDDFEREWFSGSDVVIAHTSGSTGVPKEIALRKSDMRASAKATNTFFGIDNKSVLAIPLSADYIAGKMMAVRAFEAGCSLDVIEPKNVFVLPRHADLLSVVPSQLPCLLSLAGEKGNVARNVVIGGASVPARLLEMCRNTAMFNAYCSFGMTETCSHVALMDLKRGDGLYHAMPGISFAKDERDCLVVNAPRFSFGAIVTNDIVRLHGSCAFEWLGRFDNVINSGGVKLFPEKLEEMFAGYVDRPFYIVGAPHAKWGSCVALVAEGDKSAAATVAAALCSVFPHIYIPKIIWMVQRIPRTSSGKVVRSVPDEEPTWQE